MTEITYYFQCFYLLYMQYNISADTYEQRGSCEFLQGKSWMHSALGRQFVCFRAQMLVENAHFDKDEKETKGHIMCFIQTAHFYIPK